MSLYVKFECVTCENKNCMGHGLPTTEKVCNGYKHTTTNADRIRSMTDEKLAEWLDSICDVYCVPDTGWLDWLKEEVKGDET